MYSIVQAPNPVLSKKSEKVKKIDKTILKLIADMTETLEAARDPEGVGLAAPQVGKSLQLFIVKEKPAAKVKVFINPMIATPRELPPTEIVDKKTGKKKKVPTQLEGCLSLKDIWGVVRRYDSVTITYQNENNEKLTETVKGFLATILQHEYDHLQGTLFPKRVLEQNGKLYKSVKNEKGETEFEEISI